MLKSVTVFSGSPFSVVFLPLSSTRPLANYPHARLDTLKIYLPSLARPPATLYCDLMSMSLLEHLMHKYCPYWAQSSFEQLRFCLQWCSTSYRVLQCSAGVQPVTACIGFQPVAMRRPCAIDRSAVQLFQCSAEASLPSRIVLTFHEMSCMSSIQYTQYEAQDPGPHRCSNPRAQEPEQLRQRLASALPVWLMCDSPWRPGSCRVRLGDSDKPWLHRITPGMLQTLDNIMVSARLPKVELVRAHPAEAANHRLHWTIAGLALLELPPSRATSSSPVQGRCFTEQT